MVCSRGGEHAHTQREGRHRPGNCGLAGGGVRFWCERPSGGYNPPPVALVGNERGREWGSLRPGAYWPGRGLGCVSPLLVVVAFLVVTISLGSVKGVGVGGWVWVLTIRLVVWGVWLRGSGCGLGCGLVVWVGVWVG